MTALADKQTGSIIQEFFANHPEQVDLMTEWNQARHIHGQLAVTREHLRLRNQHILLSYQAKFGALEIQAAEKQLRISLLEKKIAIMRDDPALTPELAEAIARESLYREFAELSKKRDAVFQASGMFELANILSHGRNQREHDPVELARVVRKTRKAVFWTHQDIVDRLDYTPQQKKRLRELFDRVMEIRLMEFGTMIRSEAILDEIISSIELIHQQMGIDCEEDALPEGTTEKKIDYIRIQIGSLNRQIEMLQNEVSSLMKIPDIRRLAAIMADPILCARTRENLEAMISKLRIRYLRLEEELEALSSPEVVPLPIEE